MPCLFSTCSGAASGKHRAHTATSSHETWHGSKKTNVREKLLPVAPPLPSLVTAERSIGAFNASLFECSSIGETYSAIGNTRSLFSAATLAKLWRGLSSRSRRKKSTPKLKSSKSTKRRQYSGQQVLEETLAPLGQPTSVLPAPCASDQIDQASCSREVTRRCWAGAYTRKAFKHSVCCERRLRISHAMLRAREQANSRSQKKARSARVEAAQRSRLLFLGRPPQPRALDKTHKKGAKELGTDSGEREGPPMSS